MIHTLRPTHYILLSIITLLAGMFFYGLYNELIIIRLPSKKSPSAVEQSSSQRKTMKLIYWNNEKFVTEEKELLFSTNTGTTLFNLITSWLSLLDEERLMQKKVSVQSVMLDQSGTEAYISFDRNPLSKEQSTYNKLMWIEGLLKTIKDNGIPLKAIHILVHYKHLNDPHLDFSHAWPVTGYIPTHTKV